MLDREEKGLQPEGFTEGDPYMTLSPDLNDAPQGVDNTTASAVN